MGWKFLTHTDRLLRSYPQKIVLFDLDPIDRGPIDRGPIDRTL